MEKNWYSKVTPSSFLRVSKSDIILFARSFIYYLKGIYCVYSFVFKSKCCGGEQTLGSWKSIKSRIANLQLHFKSVFPQTYFCIFHMFFPSILLYIPLNKNKLFLVDRASNIFLFTWLPHLHIGCITFPFGQVLECKIVFWSFTVFKPGVIERTTFALMSLSDKPVIALGFCKVI